MREVKTARTLKAEYHRSQSFASKNEEFGGTTETSY